MVEELYTISSIYHLPHNCLRSSILLVEYLTIFTMVGELDTVSGIFQLLTMVEDLYTISSISHLPYNG